MRTVGQTQCLPLTGICTFALIILAKRLSGGLTSKKKYIQSFSTMPGSCQAFNKLAICFYYPHKKI